MLAALAVLMDVVHITVMLIWAAGLPLLFWRRWPRASVAYTIYAVCFVLVSQLSHLALGECFLTTLSRTLWESTGREADGTFTAQLVNFVAGVRPSRDSAVRLWEAAIVVTSGLVLWSLIRGRKHEPTAGEPIEHEP